MDIRAIEMGLYHYRAAKAFTKWQKNTLPKKGTLKCPRSIVLNYFHREYFDKIWQMDNKTYYTLKPKNLI